MLKMRTHESAPKKGHSSQRISNGSAKRKTPAARRFSVHAATAPLITTLRALAICAAVVALGVFCFWAARIAFTPVHDHGQAVGNTEIGHSLRFYLDQPSIKEATRQVGGNLALLAPLGVLLPIVFPRLRTLPRIAMAGALVSTAVETAQGTLIPGRAFDIDDVILNVFGVLMAYLLAGKKIATVVRGNASP
jgi:hypothetical protein